MNLLRDPNTIAWLVMLVVGLLVAVFPAAEAVQPDLVAVFTVAFTIVAGVLIALIAGKDINLAELGLKDFKEIGKIGAMPLIGPIVDLLKPRKAMLWLATVLVNYIVLIAPAFETVQEPMTNIFLALFAALTAVLTGANAAERRAVIRGEWPLRRERALAPSSFVLRDWHKHLAFRRGTCR